MNHRSTSSLTETTDVERLQPEIHSFHHLPEELPAGTGCVGLACFVARAQHPERWRAACASSLRPFCLGRCYCAPATTNDEQRPAVRALSKHAIVLERLAGDAASTLEAYLAQGGYSTAAAALSRPSADVVAEIERSSLRGRGGAGFPTGRKWRAVLQQNAEEKFVVANGDEGDPGAYIDRFLMEEDPHSIIEGLVIAAHAVGAAKGFIYVRGEYPRAFEALTRAVDEARSAGILGARSILGAPFAFDIRVMSGRGSYVCGEETALLNAIEGRRPEVRARPPYPSESGLFGRPTLVNNIETLANVPWILRHGGDAYAALGFSTSRGTKAVSLNSLFRQPGLYEIDFGWSLRRIVEEAGGGLVSGSLKGLMIGGPLAGIVPPHLLDTPFGFEELRSIGAAVGHGGIVAFDECTSIAELVQHVFDFGAFESCGKCTPCRLGARRIESLAGEVLRAGHVLASHRRDLREVTEALAVASLCGHGGGLAEFAASVQRYYDAELNRWFI